MTEQSPRDVLIFARLLEKFDDNLDDLQEFIQRHADLGLDLTVKCADSYCRDARRFADGILDLLKRNQLGISHTFYLANEAFDELQRKLDEPPKVNDKLLVALSSRAERTFADDDALARYMAATYPGQWVVIGVRQTVLGADEDPAKLIEEFGHRSDIRMVFQEKP